MNYEEALDYLNSVRRLGSRPGLESIGYLLEHMGNPQDRLNIVHVAGTNGKGSTVAFISNILKEAGYKVGMFISPYLDHITEMVMTDGREISQDSFAGIIGEISLHIEKMLSEGQPHPTEFEIITALAFEYFLRENCDICIIETGMGGRLDATNIIKKPLLSVITSISMDHTQYLGNTLAEIAAEKAGIIKENGDVVLYQQENDIRQVFLEACREKGATLHDTDFSEINATYTGISRQIFDYRDHKDLQISLLGLHQRKNAVVAITAIDILRQKGFDVPEESLRSGLMSVKWPGRLEIMQEKPFFIIDGAHNIDGAKALRRTLDEYFPDKRRIFITGVLKDKEFEKMMEIVLPQAFMVYAVTPDVERGLKAGFLAEVAGNYCKYVQINVTIEEAIKTSLDNALPDDIICAFGSLYILAGIRKFFGLKQ